LVTGYYGMNVPYPGAGTTWGVWASSALAVLLSAGLYVSFRKRDWL
jgi:magnesium transporter